MRGGFRRIVQSSWWFVILLGKSHSSRLKSRFSPNGDPMRLERSHWSSKSTFFKKVEAYVQ